MRPASAADLATRLAWVLLFVALAACAARATRYALATVAFPYPVDYAEGPLLEQALRLGRGESVYRPPSAEPPYTVTNYPPLYVALVAPWVRALGPAYAPGRLLSWSSALVAAALTAALIRRLTASRVAAAATGLLLLVSPYVSFWAPLGRVDTLALALALGGLLATVVRGSREGWPVGPALLLTAAAFTRQSYGLAAPLAACAWLATSGAGGVRRAWRLAALLALLVAGSTLVLALVTRGGFLLHVVGANVNEFRVERAFHFSREAVLLFPVPLALAAAFVVLGRARRDDAWRLIVLFLAGAVVAGMTIGKTGSNVNYLLELSASLALACGAALAALRPKPWWQAAVLALLAGQAALWFPGSRYRDDIAWKTGDEHRRVQQELLRVIEATPGTVLADEAMGLLPLAGRRIAYQPFEMTQLARAGRWDDGPFLRALERREFAAILLYRVPWSAIHTTRWTPGMLERIERFYAPAGSAGYHVIYRPRSEPADDAIEQ